MNLLFCMPSFRTAFLAISTAVLTTAGWSAHAQDSAAAAPAPEATSEATPAPETAQAAEVTPASDAAPAAEAYDKTIPVPPPAEAAPADSASKGEATKLDKVEVTGSRLKRTDYETAAPVTVIGRDAIQRSGLTSIGDLLAQMTSAGASINNTAGTIFLSGGEFNLDLRNLGSNRVLILVNGHRWVNGLESTGTGVVDLNTIPTSVIERVEILKDGASAIYGSDAIAGVVNIITRKNYSGTEISSQYGRYEEGDGARQQHQISFGNVGNWTSVFANVSYTQEGAIKTQDRDVTAYPQVGAGKTRWSAIGTNGLFLFVPTPVNGAIMGTSRCPSLTAGVVNGVLQDPAGAVNKGPLVSGSLPPSPVLVPPAALAQIPAGLQLCQDAHTVGTPMAPLPLTPLDYHFTNDDDKFNRYFDANLQNPSKRTAFFLQLNQKIFDSVSFNFEGLYNKRKGNSQLRPQALLAGDAVGIPEIYIAGSQKYNPFHQNIGKADPNAGLIGLGAFGIRFLGMPVINSFDDDTYRLGGTFNGGFDILSQFFSWDLGYSFSKNARTEIRTGDYRKDRTALALGPAANCTGDCVPLNIFESNEGITQQMLDYIKVVATNHTNERQDDAYLNLSTDLGPIHLPAGPIAVAAGIEWRRDQFNDQPDPILVAGLSSGNNAAPTSGQTIAKEAYVELGIPLLNDLPFAKLVDLSLAGRYSKYNLSGTARTGKAGIRWKLYDDLLLRGTYSTAFRAPSVGELFLGDSDSFDTVHDPCNGDTRNDPTTNANCNADGVPANVGENLQTRSVRGGNEGLRPETARTWTYGLVFSPGFVRDLNINADFYSIRLKDFITVAGSQFILDSCYKGENRSDCEFVHRSGNGSLSFIEDRFINYAALNTAGIDGGIDYTLPIQQEYGRHKLMFDVSYLIQYDQILPVAGGGTQVSPAVGTSSGFTGIPRWKANAEYLLKTGGFTFSWQTRMIYHRDEDCNAPGAPALSQLGLCSQPKIQTNPDGSTTDVSRNTLKTIFYHNVQLGYEFADAKLTLVAGVNNVTNQDPPISRDASTGGAYFNYDVLTYDIPGVFPYVRITKKF